jgi:hypothetical protein
MERRTALRVVAGTVTALLGGCLGELPGATGPRNPPEAPADQPRETPERPDLVVETFDFEAADSGALRVFGRVDNRGDVRRTATVRVIATVDGDEFVRESPVSVDPGETAEWAVTFDLTYDTFASGGNLSVELA